MLLEYFNVNVRVFDVDSGDLLGSGFFVNEKTLVTCAHVVGKRESIKIETSLFSGNIIVPISNRNQAIDMAFLTIDPPLDIVDQCPPIISINYSELMDLPCSIYAKNEDYPNGAWTEAIVRRQINGYLIECFQSKPGYPIRAGYSGSPVWLKDYKGIIGMVKGADEEEKIFNFIGGKSILNSLDIQGLELDSLDAPRLPEKYFRIRNHYDTVINTLNKDHDRLSKLFVIFGPSGIGKTSLIIDVFNNFGNEKVWVYARVIDNISTFEAKVKRLKKGDLLVVEDVFDNHPIINSGWLQAVNCDVILITTTRQLAMRIKDANRKDTRTNYIYELNSVAAEATEAFMSFMLGSSVPQEWQKKIIDVTNGFPMFMKIICDILVSEHERQITTDNDFFSNNVFFKSILDTVVSDLELHKLIFQKWCQKSGIDSLHIDILNILSLITHIGMSDKALMYITQVQEYVIKKELYFLRRKGFIAMVVSPDSSVDVKERIIIIHQAIAKILVKDSNLDIAKFEDRYVKYLRDGLLGKHEFEKGIVQKIDLLVLELKNLWSQNASGKIDGDSFIRGLQKYSYDLDEMLPQNCCSIAKSEWIAELFQPFVSKHCQVVIPIARVISRLNKCEVLAEMMWQGVTNIYDHEHADSLARTCVIVSAFSHWVKLPNINKEFIFDKVVFHLNDVYRLDDGNATDMEIAVLIGGLCAIGLHDKAIEVVQEARFYARYKYTYFVYLILVIGLLESKFHGHNIRYIIDNNFKNIHESEAKKDVVDFLRINEFEINIDTIQCQRQFYENSGGTKLAGLSRLVSLGSHSTSFDKFVVKKRGTNSWV